ncbi:MAG: glycosyltransferase family 39 protein [Alphaproteobacteria bacterium]|nr:glycosyltransferase family 39 protein [Alphaproteobacteria bacterium]
MSEGQVETAVAGSTGRGSDDVRRGLLLVLAIVTGYAFLHAGFRLLASHVLGEDDVIDIVLSQDLRAGYDAFPRQPPLYNWVLWAAQQVFGPRLETFLIIKYGALVASAGFLYLAAYRVLKDRLFALLTVESLALIYSIAWRFHEGFTHEVGAMVAVLATTWLFLRVLQEGRALDFVGLGVAMGLGFLTEPAYVVFLVTLIIAAMLQPGLRRAVGSPPLVLAFVAALAIASPYLLWMLDEPRRMLWLTRLWWDGWQFNGNGLFDALRGPIAYLSPLLFILPIVFPKWLQTAWVDLKTSPFQQQTANYELLVLHAGLLSFAASILGALIFEINGLAVHVLMPLYLPIVIWLFGVARRAANQPLYIKRFGRLAIAIALVAFFARMANLYVMDPVCQKCRWGIPYATLAQEIRDRGFGGSGTIVSLEHELSGNLRALFPNAKLVTRGYPRFTPDGADWTRGRVVYVWDRDLPDKKAQRFLRFLLPKGIRAADAEKLVVPWQHLWRETGYRKSEWRLLIVENGRVKRVINSDRSRRLGL